MQGSSRRARARISWQTVLLFAAVCGLLGEALEVVHIQSGGIAPPGWALRAALVVAYGVGAALLLLISAVVVRRWAMALAAVGFALFALLPWLNFALLPRFGSARSLVGNAAVIVIVAVVVPLLMRARRAVGLAIALGAIAVNLWSTGRTAGGGREQVAAHAPLPFNVVLVLIDTLRADHLGAYGYGPPTSPNFDALARESAVFERTTGQAAWTKPAIASLMTGVFVHKHGVISSRDALGTDRPTLAEELGRRGYRTVAFSSNPWITPEFHFDRGFDQFESGRAMGAQLTNLYKLLRRADRALAGHGVASNLSGWAFWGTSSNLSNSERDRLLTDSAVDWIEHQKNDGFFLYVHLIGPHDPYDPPLDYARKFHTADWDGQVDRRVPPTRVQTIFDTAEPLSDRARSDLIAQYDGAIAYADAQLGRVVDALRRSGKLDRTLLIVTADHGEEFYEHHNWRHGNQLYNEVVHVPLAFRLPGRLTPGRRADLSMTVDIFPSIVSLVDQSPLPNDLDGRALFAAADAGPEAVFAEHWWLEGGTYVSRMVQRGALKLQETHDEARGKERTELYDLGGDKLEQRNLLENPDALSDNGMGELRSLLARFGDKLSVASVAKVDVDQSTKERLRQLGY